MSTYGNVPPSPRTPGQVPPSPMLPPLHPGTGLASRNSIIRRDSLRSEVARGTLGGVSVGSPSAAPRDSPTAASQYARINEVPSPSSVGSRRRETRSIRNTDRVSQRKTVERDASPTSSTPSAFQKRWGFWKVLWKSIQVLVFLLIGLVLGVLVVTRSVDWVYSWSTFEWPILTCPSHTEVLGLQTALDGSSCMLRFRFENFNSYEYSMNNGFAVAGSKCYMKSDYSTCSSFSPCYVRCFSVGTNCGSAVGTGTCIANGYNWGASYSSGVINGCTQSVVLSVDAASPSLLRDAGIAAEPMCGSNEFLTAAMIVLIRGVLASILVISMMTFFSLIVKAKVAPSITQRTISKESKSESAAALRAMVQPKWDPATIKALTTGSWKYRVRVMHALLKKGRQISIRTHAKWKLATIILVIGIAVGVTVAILEVYPRTFPSNIIVGGNSIVASSDGSPWGLAGTTWSISAGLYAYLTPYYVAGTWLDAFVVIDYVVEFVLVFFSLVFGLRWRGLLTEKEKVRLSAVGASAEACLVITLTAGTCATSRGRRRLEDFIAKANSELMFGAIFILDLGSQSTPADDTWTVTSTGVHYVYLPEPSRPIGLAWLCHTWIPFLHKQGRIGRMFGHVVAIDYETAPGAVGAVDLGTLNQVLINADAAHKATHGLMPVRVDQYGDDAPTLVSGWENMRLQYEFTNRMRELAFTGGLVISAAPSFPAVIWNRQGVRVFPDGTDAAKLVTQQRGKFGFHSYSFAKPIPVRNSIYRSYREFAKTYRDALSQLHEFLFSITSMTHWGSIGLKVFIFLGPVIGMVLVVARPFILGSLLFRDPICAAILLGAMGVLSVVTSVIHSLVSWKVDKRVSFPSVWGSIFTYPLFQLYMGCMRIGLAIGDGCSFGTMPDERVRMTCTATEEVFPCPPHPDVDWFTVWRTSDQGMLRTSNDRLETDSTFSETSVSVV